MNQHNLSFTLWHSVRLSFIIFTISLLLTGISPAQVKKNLTWGEGPMIVIEDLGLDADGQPYKGKFVPSEPDKIYIDIDLVQYLENYIQTNGESAETGSLRSLILYSVVLHELTHYADFSFDQIMINATELGLQFEQLYMGGYLEFNQNNQVIFIKTMRHIIVLILFISLKCAAQEKKYDCEIINNKIIDTTLYRKVDGRILLRGDMKDSLYKITTSSNTIYYVSPVFMRQIQNSIRANKCAGIKIEKVKSDPSIKVVRD